MYTPNGMTKLRYSQPPLSNLICQITVSLDQQWEMMLSAALKYFHRTIHGFQFFPEFSIWMRPGTWWLRPSSINSMLPQSAQHFRSINTPSGWAKVPSFLASAVLTPVFPDSESTCAVKLVGIWNSRKFPPHIGRAANHNQQLRHPPRARPTAARHALGS